MIVYFARSIRGNHKPGDRDMNQIILDAIKRAGMTPALELSIKLGPSLSGDQYIYQRDLDWIDRSDALIAEVTNPSLGVGYEIAYARHVRQLPIICLAAACTNVSAMIRGSSEIWFYQPESDITGWIVDWLTGKAASRETEQAR